MFKNLITIRFSLSTLLKISKYFILKYSIYFRSLFILFLSLLLAKLILQFIDVYFFSMHTLANYFIAIGAMIGGIIAIVFTLSIFALQNAANLYSSQYFEVYTNDWKEKARFTLIIIIILLFFSGGFYFNASSLYTKPLIIKITIYISLFLIGLIFIIIDFHYKEVREKINPINSINFIEKDAFKFINKKLAKSLSKIILKYNNKTSKEVVLASLYNSYLSPYVVILERRIENLFEISMRLSQRYEVESTNRCFNVVKNILNKYIDIRKDSSIAFSSNKVMFAVESDSQQFFDITLGKLNNIGMDFIKSNKTDNAVQILYIYNSLANTSRDMKFIGMQFENPIFDQVLGYFLFYIDIGIRYKDQEIVYQGSQILSKISLYSIDNNLDDPLYRIQEYFLKIAKFGIIDKKTYIIDSSFDGWLKIIIETFKKKYYKLDFQVTKSIENIILVILYLHNAIQTKILTFDSNVNTTLFKPFIDTSKILNDFTNKAFDTKDEKEKSFYVDNIIDFMQNFYMNLRILSEKIQNCESPTINGLSNCIYDINRLIINFLLDNEFFDFSKEFKERLIRYIYLPYWFVHHSKSVQFSLIFDSFPDTIAKTGIILFKHKDNLNLDKTEIFELFIECISSINSIVIDSVKKSKKGYGYDEPRLMLKNILLGILSLKYDIQPVFNEISEQIKNFEKLYIEKYSEEIKLKEEHGSKILGVPDKNQLYLEVIKFKEEFNRTKYSRPPIINHSEDMMFDLINEKDIDNFISKIWPLKEHK